MATIDPEDKVARWWLPDDVAFVEELPHTATGKLQKLRLREMFRDYRLPGTGGAASSSATIMCLADARRPGPWRMPGAARCR